MDYIPVAVNWDKGFQSDLARDQLAQNAAYRMVDWIPQIDAPLTKRGGWQYGSPNLGSVGGTAASVASLGFLPFPADGHLVAISNAGSVYQLKQFDGAGGSTVTDTGDTSIVPSWPIFWHKTGTKRYGIILPGYTQGAKVPKKYFDTGALAYQAQPLGGTPPMARFGFSWGDYLALGNYYDPTAANALVNDTLAFSSVGNPDSWTLTGVNASTFGFPEEIVAGVTLRNGILIFGYNDCHLLTGDTPPPGGNLSRRTLFGGIGTLDGRSVAHWRDYGVWACGSGIYQSDGATLTDLTETAGISLYYRSLVSSFAFSQGWSAVGSLYRNHYILVIRNASGTFVTCLVIDLERQVSFEWSNLQAANFSAVPSSPGTALFGGGEELFFAHSTQPYVGKVSPLWTPASTNSGDGDGAAVLPSLETGYYRLRAQYKKRVRNARVSYDIRTAGASPLLRASFTLESYPGAAYTQASPSDLATTTKQTRQLVGIRREGLGVAFKIQQVAPSASTRLYSIEVEGAPQDPARR